MLYGKLVVEMFNSDMITHVQTHMHAQETQLAT